MKEGLLRVLYQVGIADAVSPPDIPPINKGMNKQMLHAITFLTFMLYKLKNTSIQHPLLGTSSDSQEYSFFVECFTFYQIESASFFLLQINEISAEEYLAVIAP